MILDGKKIASEIRAWLAEEIRSSGARPKLVVVLVGENPASLTYIRQKERACIEAWIEFELKRFDIAINEKELLGEIHNLNTDPSVSGYLIQLPLPSHIDDRAVCEAIDPKKDVDWFTPYNIGKLLLGSQDGLEACTPKGVMWIFSYYNIDLTGKTVTIIGRSNIVGKPLALMCINAGATVTVCNSRSKNLSAFTLHSDIIICAAGKAKLLTKDMVTPGSVIIDIGINHVGGALVGDADFPALEAENYITPVPGWVGPMTVAMLLENTYLAHTRNQK